MLIQALNEYEGAVILISHDRHLVEACVDRLWMVKDQTVSPYDGDLDSYRAELLAARSSKVKKEKGASTGRSKKEQRQLAAKRREELAPMRKEIKGFRATDGDLEQAKSKRWTQSLVMLIYMTTTPTKPTTSPWNVAKSLPNWPQQRKPGSPLLKPMKKPRLSDLCVVHKFSPI